MIGSNASPHSRGRQSLLVGCPSRSIKGTFGPVLGESIIILLYWRVMYSIHSNSLLNLYLLCNFWLKHWSVCKYKPPSVGLLAQLRIHQLAITYSDHQVRSVDKSQREKSIFKERKKNEWLKLLKLDQHKEKVWRIKIRITAMVCFYLIFLNFLIYFFVSSSTVIIDPIILWWWSKF
jgi:hypothetical protein